MKIAYPTLQQLKDAKPQPEKPLLKKHTLALSHWLQLHAKRRDDIRSQDGIEDPAMGRPPGAGPLAKRLIEKIGFLKYMCMTTLERDFAVRKMKRREFTQKRLEEAARRRMEEATK